MGTFTVSKNFAIGKYSDEAMATKAQVIHDSMNGNAHYPTPSPSLTDLQTAISDFLSAIVKSKDGSKGEPADKNAKREIL